MRTDTIQAHAMCMQGLFTCINLITSQQLNHTHIHIKVHILMYVWPDHSIPYQGSRRP